MKIAMIGQKGLPARFGGVERHVEELAAELAQHGNEVLVFCRSWYSKPSATISNVRCITTPSLRTKHLDTITHTFTSIIRAAQEKVDVFHFQGVGPALLAWLPRLIRPQARVVVTFHCIDRSHGKWGVAGRVALRLGEWMAVTIPDATVVVSKSLQTYVRMQYGRDAMYIPNGTRFHDSLPDFQKLRAFKLEPNKYFMFCARLVQHKGAHTLIEAWKELRRTQPELTADMKIAIVGGSAFTDSYVKQLKQMAQDDESIVLTGNQSGETLHALFSGSYAVVQPSTSEGLPISILEAMSYGKCVLSTDIPENLELTAEHGLSFRANQTEDLVRHMAMLLEHPDLVDAVGKDARKHVAIHYDWSDIGEKTVHLYEALDYVPQLHTRRV